MGTMEWGKGKVMVRGLGLIKERIYKYEIGCPLKKWEPPCRK